MTFFANRNISFLICKIFEQIFVLLPQDNFKFIISDFQEIIDNIATKLDFFFVCLSKKILKSCLPYIKQKSCCACATSILHARIDYQLHHVCISMATTQNQINGSILVGHAHLQIIPQQSTASWLFLIYGKTRNFFVFTERAKA